MSESARTVTRQELYDQVWSTPVSKLARDYGVSDVAIAKACKRLNVPRPPRGYWAQIAVGRRIKKPALPKQGVGKPDSTTIDPAHSTVHPKVEKLSGLDIPQIAVPEDLRGCHPLISATRKSFEKYKPQESQLLWATDAGSLNIAVSRISIHRGLCILEALIRTAESLGWKVESIGERGGTQITPGNDPVSLELREKVDRSEMERPPGERYWYKKYIYTPTGHLVIRITDYLDNGMRRSWGDGKRQRIEDVLPEIVAGVKLSADNLLERRLKHEAWERECEERRRRREELNKRIKVEKERRERMESEVLGWQKAAAMRHFCDELQKRMEQSPQEYPAEAVMRWIAWVRALAAKRDPFENGYIQSAIEHDHLDPSLDCESPVSYW